MGVGVGGWVGGGDPPPFSMLLESYCSLENPFKKGSPVLALAHLSYKNTTWHMSSFLFCAPILKRSRSPIFERLEIRVSKVVLVPD